MVRREDLQLLGLIGAEIALVAGLHALARLEAFFASWSETVGGFTTTAFEEVVARVMLAVALGFAYWLLLSTVVYLTAMGLGRSTVAGVVRRVTPAPIRRLVARAAALLVAGSVISTPLAPAAAHPAGTGSGVAVMMEVDGRARVQTAGTETPSERIGGSLDVILPPHLRPPAEPDAAPGPVDGSVVHAVTVRRGDHLWSLAERHLQRVWNRTSIGEQEIARYWVQVIAANRGSIRSGDPDRIYPGEVIALPGVEGDQ